MLIIHNPDLNARAIELTEKLLAKLKTHTFSTHGHPPPSGPPGKHPNESRDSYRNRCKKEKIKEEAAWQEHVKTCPQCRAFSVRNGDKWNWYFILAALAIADEEATPNRVSP